MYPLLCYPSPFYSVLPSPQFSSRATPRHSTRFSPLHSSLPGLPLVTLRSFPLSTVSSRCYPSPLYVVPSSVLFLRCYSLPLYIVFPSLSLSLLCFSHSIILASLHSVGRLIGILAHPRTHIFPLAGASMRGKEYSSNEKGKVIMKGRLICCVNRVSID